VGPEANFISWQGMATRAKEVMKKLWIETNGQSAE